MRFRVVGFISVSVLLIAMGALWASHNFAAQPSSELMHRAYTFIAIGASRVGNDWIEDAAPLFERAAAGDITSVEAHLMAALSYEVAGDPARALHHYEIVRSLAPSFPVDALMGDTYLEQGELIQAEAAYLRALEIDPQSIKAFSGLARVTEAAGRLVESEAHLRRIVSITEGETASYINLSRFFLRTGQLASALSVLEEIAEQKRVGAAYFAQLGFVYESLERGDDACAQLRSALRLGSSDPDVSAAIERLACGSRM